MRKYFLCLFLAFFIFGCASGSSVKAPQSPEIKEYSSAFYAIRLSSTDGWNTASVVDSDDNSYDMVKQNAATGLLLKSDKVSVHIKAQFALFTNEFGEMIVLEEVR